MTTTKTMTLALLLGLFTASNAAAKSDSLITLGVGTTVGVNNITPLHADTTTTFTTELSLKVKMLHFLGVEFAYSPTDGVEEGVHDLVFDSTFRVSGLVYIVPTYPVNLYLKGGIGAGKIEELFAIDQPTNSYHAGAGMDFHIGEHFVLGAEFLLLIPGVNSVKNTIETFANEELRRYQERTVTEATYEPPQEQLSIEDFISANNFRVSVSARYYF